MKKMSQKLEGWKPQTMPDPEMASRLRQYIVEAVMARWNEKQQPSTLLSIFFRVTDRIAKERQNGQWKWHHPSKRTIDRQVNNAADPRYYGDKIPKIVAVTAGVYKPNPQLFEEKTELDIALEAESLNDKLTFLNKEISEEEGDNE